MTPVTEDREAQTVPEGAPALLHRISRLEIGAAVLAAAVMVVLTLAEPDILEAPFENWRTVVFTFGGTALAAVALVVMLWFRVPAVIRVVVLGVPFVAVSWWLISPFFIDDVVNDEFSTSIADASDEATDEADEPAGTDSEGGQADPATTPTDVADPPDRTDSSASAEEPEPTPAEPVLRGSGSFVGLAGHSGTGEAGFFELPDGSYVLRLEQFDIQNGPDLRLYVVPGADQTDPLDGSLYLGDLRGNVGDQTYEIPADFPITSGDWTVLVWCEAFSVEFVGATVAVS